MAIDRGLDVVCRPERPGEGAAVRAVVADAFVAEPVVADLVDALRASPDWIDGLSLVADAGEDAVGVRFNEMPITAERVALAVARKEELP